MATSYLLQEDGTSKIILEDGSGFLILETGGVGVLFEGFLKNVGRLMKIWLMFVFYKINGII